MDNGSHKKQNKRLLLLIVLLLLIIAALVFLLLKPEDPTPGGQGISFQPTQTAQAGTSLPEITIPGRTILLLPAGKTEADVSFYNPEKNKDYYNLSFCVKLKQTGEVLFETGQIEPGYQCTKVTLSRALEAGEYDIIILVQPYLRDEANTPTNNAELAARLIVE